MARSNPFQSATATISELELHFEQNTQNYMHYLLSPQQCEAKYLDFKRPKIPSSQRKICYTSSPNAKEIVEGFIYFKSKKLGHGSNGTKVFEGDFNYRRIAVKRVDRETCEYHENEVNLLNAINGHPNVIKYICTEVDEDYRYIGLELCHATLWDLVQKNDKGQVIGSDLNKIEILQQCTKGLNYIHGKNIIHRDLKPSNILLRKDGNGKVIAKISDFGLGKKINERDESFTNSGGDTGTQGWKAPEVSAMIKGHRMTSKVDVFALGCIFYYFLTEGTHPFGDNSIDRQFNIREEKRRELEIADDNRGITDLIKMMLSKVSNDRPSTSAILKHPMFLNDHKIFILLKEINYFFHFKHFDRGPMHHCVNSLVASQDKIFTGKWATSISPEFQTALLSKWDYNGIFIQNIITALINMYDNYHALPLKIREEIGSKSNYFDYWLRIFPELLPNIWTVFYSRPQYCFFGEAFLCIRRGNGNVYVGYDSSDDSFDDDGII